MRLLLRAEQEAQRTLQQQNPSGIRELDTLLLRVQLPLQLGTFPALRPLPVVGRALALLPRDLGAGERDPPQDRARNGIGAVTMTARHLNHTSYL